MKTIYKYPIDLDAEFSLLLPQGAQVLSIQQQRGDIFLWALVDKTAMKEERRFRTVGTGHSVPDGNLKHIATVQDSIFVWHFFEEVA